MYWLVRLGSIENRMELGAAKGHRWAGQIHLPPSLMDRKFQIFCKNEEKPYYLKSIKKQKLVVHYDPLGTAGGRWGPLGAAGGR